MFQKRRQRLITHSIEDQREEIFEGLKMKLEVVHELNDIFKSDIDPMMRKQVEIAKQDLRNDFRELLKSGVSVMDLYKRFGGMMFKAEVLEKQHIIQQLSQGKEKQLIDLLNEDEKLVQRLNNLNDPINQQYKQRLRNDPLQVRPDEYALKQEYEKQQILKQFARGLVQIAKNRRFGPGGGQNPRGQPPHGNPPGGPPHGGPPPGNPPGGAPPHNPGFNPRPPRQHPGQFPPGGGQDPRGQPPHGPQGGGGGIMRQAPRAQYDRGFGEERGGQTPPRQAQMLEGMQMYEGLVRREDAQTVSPRVRDQMMEQQELRQQLQQAVPQLSAATARSIAFAMSESERKRKDRLLIVPRRQPLHQPVEEVKIEEEVKRPKSRTRTRTEANLQEPIIQQVAKRKKSKTKSRSRTRIVEERKSPHFNEIIDPRSGFYFLSPNNPLFLSNQKDKIMENEEGKFNSPRDTPEVDTQLRTLRNQIRRDETSLRRPGQSVSQTRSQNQQDIAFETRLNERETIMQMTQMYNNFYEQLRQNENYNSRTEDLLRTIERPLGLLKDEQSLDRFLQLIFPMMDQFTLAKGVAIDQDIKEKNFEHYRGQIDQALDNYASNELNRQRLAQSLVEIVMEYFEDMIREQQKRNPPKMIASGDPQIYRGPDPDPEQDPVVADQPTPSRREILDRNQNSEFKKHYLNLLKNKKYAQVLEDSVIAYQNQNISATRFLKAVANVALKFPNSNVRQIFKDSLRRGQSEQEILELIGNYYEIFLNYFKTQEQSNMSSGISIQQPSQSDLTEEIKEEAPIQVGEQYGPVETSSVQTRSQQRIGRSLLVAPRREQVQARSTSAIRAVNKQKQTEIRAMIQGQNHGGALEYLQQGIQNFILNSQASRNKEIQKPDFFFSTDTAELQKIVNEVINTQNDEAIKAQLIQEYQALGTRSKTLQYARNLYGFLDSIRNRFMAPV